MFKERRLIIFVMTFSIVFSSITLPVLSPVSQIGPKAEYALADVTMFEPLVNEDLIGPVDVSISGNSGEFSSKHFTSLNGDSEVVRLNWTHTANIALVETGYHPSQDFIFFTQTFDYPFNEIPRKMYLEMECTTTLGGDFTADDLFGGIGFWLIDPSGNWEEPIVHSPYDEYQEWNMSYEYGFTALERTFDGTIEIDGVQEDPNDQITIAFGLTPAWWFFRGESGSENWRLYNGSMIVDIDRIDITIVRPTAPDDPHIEEPTKSYRFPHDQGIESFGEIISDDEFLYAAGTGSGFLAKWTHNLNLIWISELPSTVGYGIALYNDSILVGGVKIDGDTNSLSFSRWSTDGQLEWESIIDFEGYNEAFEDIAIDSEGFMYASIRRYISGSSQDSLLLKLNSDGNIIWNRTLSQQTSSTINIIDDNQIFVVEEWSGILKVFNSSGAVIRERTGISMATYHNGSIVGVRQGSIGTGTWSWTQLTLCGMDVNLAELWNSSMNIPYNLGYYEKVNTWDLEITSEGSILVYLYLFNIANELRLYKFDANGQLDWYKIVGFTEYWWGYPMSSASNGLVYFTTRAYDGTHSLTGIDAFIYGDYTPSLNPPEPLLITSIIGIGAVVVVAVMVIQIRKRR